MAEGIKKDAKQGWIRKAFGRCAKGQAFTAGLARQIFDKGAVLLQAKGLPIPVSKGISALAGVAQKAWKEAGRSAGEGDDFTTGLIRVKKATVDAFSEKISEIKTLLTAVGIDLDGDKTSEQQLQPARVNVSSKPF